MFILLLFHYNALSPGEFLIAEGNNDYIDKLLQSFRPSEIIYQRNKQKLFKELFTINSYTYTLDEWVFTNDYSGNFLLNISEPNP